MFHSVCSFAFKIFILFVRLFFVLLFFFFIYLLFLFCFIFILFFCFSYFVQFWCIFFFFFQIIFLVLFFIVIELPFSTWSFYGIKFLLCYVQVYGSSKQTEHPQEIGRRFFPQWLKVGRMSGFCDFLNITLSNLIKKRILGYL